MKRKIHVRNPERFIQEIKLLKQLLGLAIKMTNETLNRFNENSKRTFTRITTLYENFCNYIIRFVKIFPLQLFTEQPYILMKFCQNFCLSLCPNNNVSTHIIRHCMA